MRTTLTLDDDIFEAARSLAQAKQRSLGKVISDLVRRGLEPRTDAADFPVFRVSPNAQPITLEMVKEALTEPRT
jgi:hypothetical protein